MNCERCNAEKGNSGRLCGPCVILWVDSPEREALMKDHLRNYDTMKAALDAFIAKDNGKQKENAETILEAVERYCDTCGNDLEFGGGDGETQCDICGQEDEDDPTYGSGP